MSEQNSPQLLISLNDLKTTWGHKSEGKSAESRREIKARLDKILENGEWEADDIIDYHRDHDYSLSPILDCIIYYVTGGSFEG